MKKLLSAVVCAALLASVVSMMTPIQVNAEENDGQAISATHNVAVSSDEKTEYTYDDEVNGNTYKYVILDDETIKITQATCSAHDVVVPKTINGRKVTVIGSGSFRHNIQTSSNLNSITLPYGVKIIEEYAFYDLDMVTQVNLSNTVEEIGNGAFAKMDALEEVQLSNSLYTIGEEAFSTCPSLKNIELPDTLNFIGMQAFCNCSALTDLKLPQNLISIGARAFKDCVELTNVVFPDSVTNIGTNAFAGCTGILYVEFGSGIADFGETPFANCDNLEEFEVATDNLNFSSKNGVVYNKDKSILVMYPNAREDNFIIPDTVKIIGERAFYGSKITGVTFPSGLEEIQNNAFYNCTGLCGKCELPDSLKVSGGQAFYGCSGITEFYLGKNLQAFSFTQGLRGLQNIFVSEDNDYYTDVNGVLFRKDMSELLAFPGGRTGSYSVPNGVEVIGAWAFFETSLESVSMPDSVTEIGEYAFARGQIKSIRFSEALNNIGWGSFKYCTSLVLETVPSSVKIISSYVFEGCTSIQYFVIPENVEELGYAAFGRCTALKSVEINSEKIKVIEGMTFANCSSLTEVKMPMNLQAIESSAFQDSPYVSFWCYKYSVAQEFAENHNIPYELIKAQFLRGDVNRDGDATSLDSYIVLRGITGAGNFDAYSEIIADANNDGEINSIDALEILRYAVGYETGSLVGSIVEI